ncbi:MAG: DUF6273 domain-containing protein [Firmicutes bacterium]|nr:DUF6273 domain-containing protein [Bacillota bacterium]MCL1953555.1 DUF6273 domain-containing protein [Bacillota bacterium]
MENNKENAVAQLGTRLFGIYGQTKKGKDNTPIEWIELDNDGTSVLMIAKFILDSGIPYNTTKVDISWKNCSIRQWLNNEFFNKAFVADDKSKIKLCDISGNGISGADDDAEITQDKVFLLNTKEASQYFAKTVNRLAQGTEFAKNKGKTLFKSKGVLDIYKEHSWWWLRNRGSYGANLAALVDNGGNVNPIGDNVHFLHGGVRPCIRVLLS